MVFNIREDDWKKEKHVPVIEVIDIEEREDKKIVTVSVSIGKEIAHPNEPEHHIKFVELYVSDGNVEYLIGRTDFDIHGKALSARAQPEALFKFEIDKNKKVTLKALSFCNIHGLWSSEKEI